MSLIKNKLLTALPLSVVILSCSNGSSTTSSVSTVSFSKIGTPITATEVNTVFVARDNLYVSINGSTPNESGNLSYLKLPIGANSTSSYVVDQLKIESNYSLFGNILVNNDGVINVSVKNQAESGFKMLSYTNDNRFVSATTIASDYWMRFILFSAYNSANIYFNYNNGNNGDSLCYAPIVGGSVSCYDKLFPTWYNGEFAVVNDNVYYSGIREKGIMVFNFTTTDKRMVGTNFSQLPENYRGMSGLVDVYQNNVFIGAMYSKGSNNYLAVCYVPTTATKDTKWHCAYDTNVQIPTMANMTNLRVGHSSGEIVISIDDSFKNSTVQLYKLPSSTLTK